MCTYCTLLNGHGAVHNLQTTPRCANQPFAHQCTVCTLTICILLSSETGVHMMQAPAFYVNVKLWFKTVFKIAQIKLKCRQRIFTLLKIFNISTFFQLIASFVVWKQNYLQNSPQLRFCDFFLSFFNHKFCKTFVN